MKYAKIKQFAKDNGYETVKKLKHWNGYEVYEPIMEKGTISFIGPPLVILVKGDEIRMSTVDEAYKQLQTA